MTTAGPVMVLAVALAAIASPAQAQLGEAQFGVIASYGPGRSAGPTAGFVAGVATGRLFYLGLRGTRHGETRSGTPPGPTAIVTNRATAVAADLAVVIPAGPLEVMVGASIGAVRHSQRVVQLTAGGPAPTTNGHATEFLAAPSLSAEVHAGPVALIPELQYQFSGQTDFAYPVRRVGWLASLRVVVHREVRRVRS